MFQLAAQRTTQSADTTRCHACSEVWGGVDAQKTSEERRRQQEIRRVKTNDRYLKNTKISCNEGTEAVAGMLYRGKHADTHSCSSTSRCKHVATTSRRQVIMPATRQHHTSASSSRHNCGIASTFCRQQQQQYHHPTSSTTTPTPITPTPSTSTTTTPTSTTTTGAPARGSAHAPPPARARAA